MDLLIVAITVVVLLFSFVILRGAPYLPTLKQQIEDALDLLELKEGQNLLELGSGDGRFLAAAARRGLHSVGYELNPLLVIWTRLRYHKYRKFISVKWGDYWKSDWPKSDGMYVFLLQKYMKKLDTKLVQYLSQPNTIYEQSAKPLATKSLLGNFRRFLSDTQFVVRIVRLLPFLKNNDKTSHKIGGLNQAVGKNYKVVSFGFTIPNRKPTKTKKGLSLYKYN